jgi:uncharacterized repeat protein (TIGR03803 family)
MNTLHHLWVRSLLLTLLAFWAPNSYAQLTILHDFTGGPGDGANPYGSLCPSGDILYGMTYNGGVSNFGVVFTINTDGSGYTNLHEFTGGPNDGRNPYGSLIRIGGTLYGMTRYGGDNDYGVVFKVSSTGSGYTHLHEFSGGPGDGREPFDSLGRAGFTLYGSTYWGGASDDGVLFSIETDGSNYTNLHEYAGSPGGGNHPKGTPWPTGGLVYDLTRIGGASDQGAVCRVNMDGTGFTLLHSFAGGAGDGRYPEGSPTLAGSTMYGTTTAGGASNGGVVFRMIVDGTGYTNLHEFAGGTGDGSDPWGEITRDVSFLYGTTSQGGAYDNGVVFRMGFDGSDYTNLHEFSGTTSDGSTPRGALYHDGAMLYGMTVYGGTNNMGVIFATPIPEPCAGFAAALALLILTPRRKAR